jgi:NAD+ kinase
MLRSAAILHHPQSEGAVALATQIMREFQRANVSASMHDVWSDPAAEAVSAADLAVCVGGDGTVLRAAQLAIAGHTPIAGVNMGRLGFLTDMSPSDFFAHFERVCSQDWRLEERVMVRARIDGEATDGGVFHGLNDVVVSRRSPGRPIYVELSIDGVRLAIYRCDGIIVATPTGSTGYSLAAGGPILSPTEHHLVVTPVSAHLALSRSLVLQPESEVFLRVTTDHGAVLSVDGQRDLPLASGATVDVRMSEHTTRFVRFRDPGSFYGELAAKLDTSFSSPMNAEPRA